MLLKYFFLVAYLLLIFHFILVSSLWWRRRRSRRPPPSPVNCRVSPWTPFSACSSKCGIGTITRRRHIIKYPAYGGSSCPYLVESRQCGSPNGRCGDICNPVDGSCSCVSRPGYKLEADGKSCGDINECENGNGGCINSKCRNTYGSYWCECLPGYKPSTMNSRNCLPKSCSPLIPRQCPRTAYYDEFGAACMPAKINCPHGRGYMKSCSINCNKNFKIAVIKSPNIGEAFAENFRKANFKRPNRRTVCSLDRKTENVIWDWNPNTSPYYCRRINDPPSNIVFSNIVIDKKIKILSSIGHFTANDPQDDQLTFTIVNAEANFYFLIQGNLLLAKKRLVWKPQSNNIYTVKINVSDNGSPVMFTTKSFNITVLNINDPPYDIKLSNNEVFENVNIGFVVGKLTARDDDLGQKRTSNFTWEMVDSDMDYFKLLGHQIIVAKILDHEAKNVHRIKVKCTDSGNPPKSSSIQSLFIVVRDSNDSLKYINLTNNRVPENSDIGTIIGNFVTIVEDNSTLNFDLNGNDVIIREKFALLGVPKYEYRIMSGKFGEIFSAPLVVKGLLDYEKKNEYIVGLAVSDPGGVTHKDFRIEVTDVNEAPTDILLSNKFLAENSLSSTMIGEFLVKDPDVKSVPPQTHICSLENSLSGDEDEFYISHETDRNILRVNWNNHLDFERKSFYNINVTCHDAGFGISKLLKIFVTDLNEAPTSLYLSNSTLQENSPNMTYIGTLTAEDPDGSNQSFTYTLTDNTASFLIGGTNHDELFHLGSVDYELTPSLLVHVIVTDGGGLHFEKILTINVLDVNDVPTDIELRKNSFLKENSVENIFISNVVMIDEDKNTKTSCKLLDSSEDRMKLNLLTLLVGPRPTDYESLDSSKSLKINISCEDEFGMSINKLFVIPVKDVNEPPSMMELIGKEIRENMNSSFVGIVNITDPDVGQRFDCRILKSRGAFNNASFYIDNNSNPPILKTLRPLDFEDQRMIYINVKCKEILANHNELANFMEQQFRIDVIDINEYPKIHCDAPFIVWPSFSSGSAIGLVTSYDPDNERFYKSQRENKDGSTEVQKQLLQYSLGMKNATSWPFDISNDGILYLEKSLSSQLYNGSITFPVRVNDDGTLLEIVNDTYQIKTDEIKQSIENCTLVIATNDTNLDIQLSSNLIHESASSGSVIGYFSLVPARGFKDSVTYHLLKDEDDVLPPFEINGNILSVKKDSSLDYERLTSDKTIPIRVSSRAKKSGVFTKIFLIKVLDVNEEPTSICLMFPRHSQDCSVVGEVFIEDLDYPQLKCDLNQTLDLQPYSNKLSEYTCHIEEGKGTLSNLIEVNDHFYVKDRPPKLYVKKNIFHRGHRSYDVPILCRSTLHPLHILSKILVVDIQVPDDDNCRDKELCTSCPQPKFCLSNVKAGGKCVDEEHRINLTINILPSFFKKPGFIISIESYVKNVIEGNNNGKSLKNLVQEFEGKNIVSKNIVSRKRRSVRNTYVELLLYMNEGRSTKVVLACAEKPNYNLILASDACALLENTDVQCLSDPYSSAERQNKKTNKFPQWSIYVSTVGIIIVLIVIFVIIWRKQKNVKLQDTPIVHFNQHSDTVVLGSMDETLVDNNGYVCTSVGKRQLDVESVFNPVYHQGNCHIKGNTEITKEMLMIPYPINEPPPSYEQIENIFYERADEVRTNENVGHGSRDNPLYDFGLQRTSDNPLYGRINKHAHLPNVAE
ncbi:protein dachsous-like isoform X2 [Xenia sp. Carnegie-2017]|uniref:protein dachsous-like isoform X2 n=1 Tax=Xenia sp. Carnegie-2017 TaxID=2897299 RepID=UPI001F03F180|nr:protein dachsous-like isoform X2 [Xenia sp. Carnegie-2017]